ncbi:hypothetical protein M2352_000326 [Azospirillum fermentarium]|nr:hypothetical protein [Azospirillum fermentarium]
MTRAFCDACAEGSIPPGVAERLGKAREEAWNALEAFRAIANERSEIHRYIEGRTGLVAAELLSIYLEDADPEGCA